MEKQQGIISAVTAEMRGNQAASNQSLPTYFSDLRTTLTPDGDTLGRCFERQVKDTPDKLALIWQDESLTYVQLNEKANQVAHFLVAQGVGPDTPVGVCMERTPAMLIAILGIVKAGGCYLPLDPQYPEERLAHMLSQSQCEIVLSDSDLLEELALLSSVRTYPMDGRYYDAFFTGLATTNLPDSPLSEGNLAYCIYTSGSTGLPKGTCVTHGNVISLIDNHYCDFSQKNLRILCAASPSFDAFTFELWGALLHGGCCVLAQISTLDFHQLGRLIDDKKITCAWLTAALFNQVVAYSPSLLAGLNTLLVGGEALSAPHILKATEAMPDTVFVNGYGPTECTTFACTDVIDVNEVAESGSVPIGRALTRTQLYIVDTQGRLVADGEEGELLIGGFGVSRGYLHNPALTAEKFIPNPFSGQGDRVYCTGDRVRTMPNGKIAYLGRADSQIKIRGFRIEPDEIQRQIMAQPGILQAAVEVYCAPDGTKSLVAYLVVRSGEDEDALKQLLQQTLRERLPEYMVPRAMMVLRALPLTVNGKLDRFALPEIEATAFLSGGYEAPESETEKQLAVLWEKNLGLSQLGTEDNYIALGGDSIKAIALVSEARKLGWDIAIRHVFSLPTIKELAAHLDASSVRSESIVSKELAPFELIENDERQSLFTQYREADIEDAFPMSQVQQGMLYHFMQGRSLNLYHDVVTYQVETRFDGKQWLSALNTLIKKHAILRSVFCLTQKRPLQVVLHDKTPDLQLIDLSGEAASAQEHSIRCWLEEEKVTGFDPEQTLYRFAVFKLADDKVQIALSFHHAMWDGWSDAVFVQEWVELSGETDCQASTLTPPPGYQYFIADELAMMADNAIRKEWQEKLASVSLPWWSSAVKKQSTRFECDMPPGSAGKIQQLASKLQVQEKSIWAAIYLTLLAVLDGKDNVAGSVVTHTRPEREGAERTLGLFLNSLPLCGSLNGETWNSLIRQIDGELTRQYAVRQYPLAEIQRHTGLDFSSSLFNYIHFHVHDGQGEQSQIRNDLGFVETNYLFALNVRKLPSTQGFQIQVSADTGVFDSEFRNRIGDYLQNIISAVSDLPESRIDRQALIGEAELCRLRDEWNLRHPTDLNSLLTPQLVEKQVAENPSGIAMVDGDNYLSFGELNRRANYLAAYLRERGIGPENRVGVCMERSLFLPVSLLAVLKSGAAYVPVNPSDPVARLAFIARDAALNLLLVDAKQAELLQPQLGEHGCEVKLVCADDMILSTPAGMHPNLALSEAGLHPQSLAYILYTSGTTGTPKGVMVAHGSLAQHCIATTTMRGFDTTTRNLQFAPVNFDAATAEYFNAMISGSQLHLPAQKTISQHQEFEQYVWQHRINRGYIPPAFLTLLDTTKFSQYVSISVGGEAVAQDVIRKWSAVCPVMNAYGPTECTIAATSGLCSGGQRVSIGKPLPYVQTYITDDSLSLLPTGVVGELYVGGEGLGRGYLNNPALTAERFLPDPFSTQPGSRLYQTGDRVRWLNNGTLEFVGRKDDQLKLRGQRIEPEEIQSRIEAHPGVADAVVVIQNKGKNSARLVAFFSPAESVQNAGSLAGEVRARLQSELPAYMVPALFVQLPVLPTTLNGKVDKKQLETTEINPVAISDSPSHGLVDELLTAIWCDILDVSNVGRHDNFFDVGGHSLLATQLVARIRQAFSVELTMRTLFECPTIADMSQRIRLAMSTGETAAIRPPIQKQPHLMPELSFAQQRLWFISKLTGPDATYNIPLTLRLSGKLSEDALAHSLNKLIARHEALRTRFIEQDGEPAIFIDPYSERQFSIENVHTDSEVAEIRRCEQQYLFDLENDTLFRVRIVRESADSHLLLLTFHHIIADGWSMTLLFKELGELYDAYVQGQHADLTPLPVTYSDFARWQKAWLADAAIEHQLSYWSDKLAGLPPLLTLPSDRPRPSQQTFNGGNESFSLDSDLSERLTKISREQGVTLFTTLFSAFSVLLSRYAGQEDFAVGVPVANRSMKEIEPLVGFFVNTLVMRTDLAGNPTFRQLMKRNHVTALEAFAHQDVPFEKLVQELNPERHLSHSPLFQVMFSLQSTQQAPVPLDGLEVVALPAHEFGVSRFDLTLYLTETADGLKGNIEYNSDLFDRQTIRLISTQLEALLNGISRSIDEPVTDYALEDISAVAAREALWRGEEMEDTTWLHDKIAALADHQPELAALYDDNGVIGYARLHLEAENLASRLYVNGLQPSSVVGIKHVSPVVTAITLLAVLRCHASYVVLDPAVPVFRQHYMTEQTGMALLVDYEPDAPLFNNNELSEHWQSGVSVKRLKMSNQEENASNTSGTACLHYANRAWHKISHYDISCLEHAQSVTSASLLGLDSFSGYLWWHWLRQEAVSIKAVSHGLQSVHLKQGDVMPLPLAGKRAAVRHHGQPVEGGRIGELYLGNVDKHTESAAETMQEDWVSTGYQVRVSPDNRLICQDVSWRYIPQQPTYAETCQRARTFLTHHADIEDACVVGRSGSVPHDERLCIYLTGHQAEELTSEAQVIAYLKQSRDALILPHHVQWLETLPRTKSGDVRFSALPPLPAQSVSARVATLSGDIENRLAAIWCDVLRCDEVDRNDNFFELGGYSLIVTQLASRIERYFGVKLSVKMLFDHQTIAEQAVLIQASDASALPPVIPMPPSAPKVLSFAQQRLWFLWQLMGPSAVYNIPLVLCLDGDLDVTALSQSLSEIQRRHDILRTRFVSQGDFAIQQVAPYSYSTLIPETVTSREEINSICQHEREYLFNLADEVPLRIRLLKTAPEQHYLLITMHHILTDGWSTDLLFNELKQLYRSFHRQEASGLEPLSVQYADYAYWQRETLGEEELEQQLDYWKTKLAGLPPLLELPTDFVRPAEQQYRGSVSQLELGATLSDKIRAMCREQGVTLFMTLLGVFSMLLSRYSRQNDIAIGTPSVNRQSEETESLIGFFLNSLVIRCDLSDNPGFSGYLQRIRQTTLEAYSHQDLPFENLVESLNPERSLAHSPLFQVSFSLINNPVTADAIDGLDMAVVMPEDGYEGVSRYDITFNLADRESGIVGAMEYNSDLFSPATINRMQAQYIALLEAVVAEPYKRLSDYAMIAPSEQALLMSICQQTEQVYPEQACVHELFEEQVKLAPHAIAATWQEQTISYETLNQRANQVAHYLRSQGVGPEQCVGLCLERSLDMLVGFLAILKAGGCYVVLDPEYPESRLEYMLEQSQCQLILSDADLISELEWLMEYQTIPLDEAMHETLFGRNSSDNIPVTSLGLSADNRAYVIYTSGSTGQPKGVMITHRNITSLVCSDSTVQQYQDDVVVQASNHAFDAITYEMWGALLNGAGMLIIDKNTLLQPQRLASALKDAGATVLFITTAMFNRINQDAPHAFSGLRKLLFGGEAFSAGAIETALTVGKPQELHHVYGPTECTTYATGHRLEAQAFLASGRAPIGLPLANNTAYVVNDGQLAPLGAVGELWIGGTGLSRGYLNAPGLSAEKFIPNPFSDEPGARAYRTGDLVRQLSDGSIDFVGRVDHQVKIRGFRIELGEVEAALRTHTEVKDCIVIVREADGPDRHLLAYVVATGEVTDADSLKLGIIAHLQKSMPDYVVPKAIMLMPALPLNQNGKVDRKALPEPEESAFARVQYVAPQNATEQALVEVWQEVVGLAQIGTQDNFFAIGGDSIRSISVVAACKERGIYLSVKDLFANPTIAALAGVVSQNIPPTTETEEPDAFGLLSDEESDALLQDIAAEDL